MFGLTGGELFVVSFILISVVSAELWPALGERLSVWMMGKRGDEEQH